MRLWHQALIPLLDNKRLSDVHMSCCNLRGLGWGKKNAAVAYLYSDTMGEEALYFYHCVVMSEMEKRKYNFERKWIKPEYCGKRREARVVDDEKFHQVRNRHAYLSWNYEYIFNDGLALQHRGVITLNGPRIEMDRRIYTLTRDEVRVVITKNISNGEVTWN